MSRLPGAEVLPALGRPRAPDKGQAHGGSGRRIVPSNRGDPFGFSLSFLAAAMRDRVEKAVGEDCSHRLNQCDYPSLRFPGRYPGQSRPTFGGACRDREGGFRRLFMPEDPAVLRSANGLDGRRRIRTKISRLRDTPATGECLLHPGPDLQFTGANGVESGSRVAELLACLHH
jgi:hypothetical protein